MKILFIENRHKTYFYEPIAKRLLEKGHEIHWMIQNKEFTPSKVFHHHIIDYPKGDIEFTSQEKIEDLIKIDRQFNYFEQKDTSYFYYYNEKIKEVLNKINPEMVFGESTAFHELLTILNCKEQEILYLNPSSCRYPVGRFSFYLNDTLEPYEGSNEVLSNTEAEKIIDQIVHRTSLPDYMRSLPPSKVAKVNDRVLKTKSYFFGEKFNTPNPKVKYRLEKQKKKLITAWDEDAITNLDELDGFCVLYPLQMQPEANLDVWGRRYRDQKELIQALSDSIPDDVKLIVKPNPKSNYELSQALISLVKERNNIVPVHHQVKMDDVLPQTDLVITVTGTIAIECILSDKPVATLIKTINNNIGSCIYINEISSEVTSVIQQVLEGSFPKSGKEEKIAFVNMLNGSSYKGKISDPFTDASCIFDKNIESLTNAFQSVIDHYGRKD